MQTEEKYISLPSFLFFGMESRSIYDLPVAGFGSGLHHFTYQIDQEFFGLFPSPPLEKGKFEVFVEVDKRHDGLTVTIEVQGYMDTNCDRCMADISLPLKATQTFLYRYSTRDEKDDEIFFIPPQTPVINVADHIYESIGLAIPIIKKYACEEEATPPCNRDVLKMIQKQKDPPVTNDSVWEVLKNVQYDKN